MVLGRGRGGPRHRVHDALRAGARQLRRGSVVEVVHRGPRQPHAQLRRPPCAWGPRGPARADLRARGRRGAHAHLLRAEAGGGCDRGRVARAGGEEGRPGGGLHADGRGGGDRGLRDREAGGALHADLLRLRPGGRRGPPSGRAGKGDLHRRWRASPRQPGADEGGCGRSRRGVSVDRARGRARSTRHGRADAGRARPRLGRPARARSRGGARGDRMRGHRIRGRADDRLHLRHHRPAQGRGARARRVPREDGLRDRLPDRSAP